jgi:hypothetical protein
VNAATCSHAAKDGQESRRAQSMISHTFASLGGCWSRRPLPREIPSFSKGLRSISRPAFIEAASLNIEERRCTVPARLPPASRSATIPSPTWKIGTSP